MTSDDRVDSDPPETPAGAEPAPREPQSADPWREVGDGSRSMLAVATAVFDL